MLSLNMFMSDWCWQMKWSITSKLSLDFCAVRLTLIILHPIVGLSLNWSWNFEVIRFSSRWVRLTDVIPLIHEWRKHWSVLQTDERSTILEHRAVHQRQRSTVIWTERLEEGAGLRVRRWGSRMMNETPEEERCVFWGQSCRSEPASEDQHTQTVRTHTRDWAWERERIQRSRLTMIPDIPRNPPKPSERETRRRSWSRRDSSTHTEIDTQFYLSHTQLYRI